jgi:hypothetical protein
MPMVDGELVSPDDAIRRGMCPECGVALRSEAARSHAESHWGPHADDTRLSNEARRRFNLILDFARAEPRAPVAKQMAIGLYQRIISRSLDSASWQA